MSVQWQRLREKANGLNAEVGMMPLGKQLFQVDPANISGYFVGVIRPAIRWLRVSITIL